MEELRKMENNELSSVEKDISEITLANKLEIIEEGIRKKYLTRLSEMGVAPPNNLLPLEDDLIDNVRLYKISEMVYQKGETATDKFTTVFNTLSTYKTSVFILIDSDGENTDFYLGVRNNETIEEKKRSTVTIGDTLKNTLIGHFPGVKIENKNRSDIECLCKKIMRQHNVASVSVVGNSKTDKEQSNEQFVQGLEKLVLAMHGRQYIGIIVAQNQTAVDVQLLREQYQDIYTKLSPLQKIQFSENESESTSRSKSFLEMSGKQKAAMIGSSIVSLAGAVGGGFIGNAIKDKDIGVVGGSMVGGQITGQLNGFISSLAPTEQITKSTSNTKSVTTENKAVTDLMQLLDENLKRINEFDSYGMLQGILCLMICLLLR